MTSSNCCYLTCIQISQETGKAVCYSHLCKNFPQFIVIHTVKGFGIVNKAEVDVFLWNSFAFLMIQQILAIWSLVPFSFLNPACTSWCSQFMYCWRILSITLLVCEMSKVAYLTYMQSTSCEMLGWMKHKLESRLRGEISITSDMQMTSHLWQKRRIAKEPLDESQRGEKKSWFNAQHSEN